MKTISAKQSELIDDSRAEGVVSLPARVLEKDLMICEALRAIAAIQIDGVAVTFSGGTCLAKAHKLLERMSEDIDLRVALANQSTLSRSGARTDVTVH